MRKGRNGGKAGVFLRWFTEQRLRRVLNDGGRAEDLRVEAHDEVISQSGPHRGPLAPAAHIQFFSKVAKAAGLIAMTAAEGVWHR